MAEESRWAKIDATFEAALDRPPAERARWLDAECAGDAPLRAQVEKLLALSEREDDALRPLGALAGPVWDDVAHGLETEPADVDLPPGHVVGAYRIQSILGRGGTGTVYRAFDPRLEREVAVKSLSRGFDEGSPDLRRLEREAKLLASLNHPNIAVVYELLFVEHVPYLVLELVPGESLAARIGRGPLALADAVAVGSQVAEAVEEAYRNGVVHRDLKPGNVMLTPSGRVKVLDFGLAKARPDAGPDVTPSFPGSAPPTTRDGVVMGTPAYMSPEQARGEPVDHRTDVWALGCILYEMVTGHRAFGGETVTETLAAVLRDDVDWQRLPGGTPPALRRLLRRCLQKDVRLRLQDVGDARLELSEMPADARGWPRLAALAPPAAMVAAGLGLAALLAVVLRGRPVPAPASAPGSPVRATLRMGSDHRLWVGGSHSFAVSPDAARLAFVGESAGQTQLFVRDLSDYAARPVRNSEEARSPFFSADGRWIGFFAQGELRKVAAAGGTAETIGAAGLQPRGASWAPDGRIVFAQAGTPGLHLLDAAGGEARLVSRLDTARGEVGHLWPQWLPGSDTVLFTVQHAGGSGNTEDLALLAIATGERRRLRQGAQASYAASGHLVFVSNGGLEAAPFDARRGELTGPAVSALDAVHAYPRAAAAFAVSASGALLYLPPLESATVDWLEADGRAVPFDTPGGTPGWPRISPDGRRVALHVARPGTREVWLLDRDRPRALRQVTFEEGGFPVWSPDGRRLAFSSRREGNASLSVVAADGSAPPRRLLEGTRSRIPSSWSRDGLLAYYEIGEGNQRDIGVVDVDGGTEPVAFVATPANELAPAFSPDGRLVAYVSNETGRNEVYLRRYPPPSAVTAVSVDGGTEPVWRRDGGALFYRHGDGIMAVAVRGAPGLSVSAPRRVLSTEMVPNSGGNPSYDVTPDGARFLVLRPAPGGAAEELRLVLGWTGELARLAPPGN